MSNLIVCRLSLTVLSTSDNIKISDHKETERSYLASDLSGGGHFPDEFLGAFLLCFAVRRLVRRSGAPDSPHHIRMDPRRGRRPLLRLLLRGRIRPVGVSLYPVSRSLPLLDSRAGQRLESAFPRCHLSLSLVAMIKTAMFSERGLTNAWDVTCRGTVGMGCTPLQPGPAWCLWSQPTWLGQFYI